MGTVELLAASSMLVYGSSLPSLHVLGEMAGSLTASPTPVLTESPGLLAIKLSTALIQPRSPEPETLAIPFYSYYIIRYQ